MPAAHNRRSSRAFSCVSSTLSNIAKSMEIIFVSSYIRIYEFPCIVNIRRSLILHWHFPSSETMVLSVQKA